MRPTAAEAAAVTRGVRFADHGGRGHLRRAEHLAGDPLTSGLVLEHLARIGSIETCLAVLQNPNVTARAAETIAGRALKDRDVPLFEKAAVRSRPSALLAKVKKMPGDFFLEGAFLYRHLDVYVSTLQRLDVNETWAAWGDGYGVLSGPTLIAAIFDELNVTGQELLAALDDKQAVVVLRTALVTHAEQRGRSVRLALPDWVVSLVAASAGDRGGSAYPLGLYAPTEHSLRTLLSRRLHKELNGTLTWLRDDAAGISDEMLRKVASCYGIEQSGALSLIRSAHTRLTEPQIQSLAQKVHSTYLSPARGAALLNSDYTEETLLAALRLGGPLVQTSWLAGVYRYQPTIEALRQLAAVTTASGCIADYLIDLQPPYIPDYLVEPVLNALGTALFTTAVQTGEAGPSRRDVRAYTQRATARLGTDPHRLELAATMASSVDVATVDDFISMVLAVYP